MNKFCINCGAPTDDDSGLCSNCSKQISTSKPTINSKEEKKKAWNNAKKLYKEDVASKKSNRKNEKKAKKEVKLSKMSKKQKTVRVLLKLLFVLFIVALIVLFAFWGLKSWGIIPSNNSDTKTETTTEPETTTEADSNGSIGIYNPPTSDMPAEFEVTSPNADEYYHNNSNITSVIDATKGGTTEADAYANLTGRGFTMYPITTNYAMDGTFSDKIEISSTGTDKHPTYSTIYVTDSGFVWSIFEINGNVYAKPVTYHLDYNPETQIIFSESESITSYDSTENKFYITQPYETSLDVIVVGRIDAETLNTFTAREIENS